MTQIIICDLCKKELSKLFFTEKTSLEGTLKMCQGGILSSSKIMNIDLCEKCYKKLFKIIEKTIDDLKKDQQEGQLKPE